LYRPGFLFQIKMAKRGPKPKYDPQIILPEIFELMRLGYSSRSICRRKDFPSWSEFMRMIAETTDEMRDQYAQARECMVDAWVIDAVDIAKDESRDYQNYEETIESPKGVTVKKAVKSDNTASQRDRLKCETILKVAAKMLPKKYGEKIQQEITGKDGLAIVVNITPKPNGEKN